MREDVAPLPRSTTSPDPLAALEAAIRPALERAPCLVAFSGGRDSSIVLAVATRLARREGLAPPIPLTVRFPFAPAAEESEWQELVVAHLELADWVHTAHADAAALDLVGPLATRSLLRHGLLYPHNAHFYAPLLERARGGTLLTGIDGDGLFGRWPWARTLAVLSGRARPQSRDPLRVAHALAPPQLRRYVARRRRSELFTESWLTPAAQRAFARAMATQGEQPLRWSAHVEAFARARYLAVGSASYTTLAVDAGAQIVHPFLDRGFLAALRDAGGARGWGDRTATIAALFGELLPARVLTRSTKALGGEIYWGEPSRELARTWDGGGLDSELVDPQALRAQWLTPRPDARSGLLLQAAWLAAQGRDALADLPPAGEAVR